MVGEEIEKWIGEGNIGCWLKVIEERAESLTV